ncbi:uncharacterized protein [Elaeis guineensis]|uniref:Uncharacterized protein LOC105041818 n=1 Tax=Elaeis guineensis var. tenera TaxID=51953 RepID=A0A6I9QZM5_ELAGV|nr:uncharacterized protein LOC105041818 [Elaeis guineensis]
MASTAAAVTMAMPSPSSITLRRALIGSTALFHPMRPLPRATISTKRSHGRLAVQASSSSSSSTKEQAVARLTAAALAAALVIPDMAEAAQPGVSPSLKNFLLSIVAGGVVLGVLVGAVIGVANFDPVKRS